MLIVGAAAESLGIEHSTLHADSLVAEPSVAARRWLAPSLLDVIFAALLIWLALFTVFSDGTAGLLIDANTGYHIRTGDYILEHGSVPRGDIFSFSKSGEPWYAWEWLSAVLFSITYGNFGMKGLILLSGAVLALSNVILLRHMVWRGANFLVAMIVMHLVLAASSIHYLARPHIFTLLLLTVTLWILDADRKCPSGRVWLLVPLTILWANLHGGFLALIASLVILAGGSVLGRSFTQARRYGLLAIACLAASAVNPYGFAIHAHAIPYLQTKWIRELVQEFQSPNFQASGAVYFEILLFAGVALSAWLLSRKRIGSAGLILAWAHAALTSMRHIPIYGIVTAPTLSEQATRLWDDWMASAPRGSARAIVRAMASDHTPGLRRLSLWTPIAVLFLALLPISWPSDFPDGKFPASIASKHADLISTSRIYTTDSWADYLTFRFYPRQKIFVDGRSDFFGQQISEDYIRILKGEYGWEALLKRYDLNAALVPTASPIASLLRSAPGWDRVDEDSQAVLFRRH